MTDQDTRDRISAIGRVAILTSASEENCDSYVEITTTDARALLDERRDLADKLAVAMRSIASFDADHAAGMAHEHARAAAWHDEAESLRAQRDAIETALNKANDTIRRVETVRCWENEDRKWFAFRDDLYEALRGDQTEADLRAARDMLRRPDDAKERDDA